MFFQVYFRASRWKNTKLQFFRALRLIGTVSLITDIITNDPCKKHVARNPSWSTTSQTNRIMCFVRVGLRGRLEALRLFPGSF